MYEHDSSDGELHADDDDDVPAALTETSVNCGEVTQAELELDPEQTVIEVGMMMKRVHRRQHQPQDLAWLTTHLVAHKYLYKKQQYILYIKPFEIHV